MTQEISAGTDSPCTEEQWAVIHRKLQSIARRRCGLDAEEAELIVQAAEERVWREVGHSGLYDYLERELGYSPRMAAERIRVAYALRALPDVRRQLADGLLHYSTVRELTRVATPETECAWLDAACGKNLREVEHLVAGRRKGDWPHDPARPELARHVLRFEVSGDTKAALREARKAAELECGHALEDDEFLQLLAGRFMQADDPAPSGTERPVPKPTHQIAVTTCRQCRRSWQNGAGVQVEVGPDAAERAHCDGDNLGDIQAPEPERVTSTVTSRMRRQVFMRDEYRCVVSGCRSAKGLEIHHIKWQSEGGQHKLVNLCLCCGVHHKQIHEGKLIIRGRAPDGLSFERHSYPPTGVTRGEC